MLERVAPRIAPVVEDLAAQDVAADAPFVLVGLSPSAGRGPAIRSSRSATSKAAWLNFGCPVPSQEQRVVVGRLLAAVAAQEGAERELRRELDLVGGDEAEAVLVPSLAGAEVGDVEHAVAEALHMRGAAGHALDAALLRGFVRASLVAARRGAAGPRPARGRRRPRP